MAKQQKHDELTQDQIRESKMTFSDDEINQGVQLINDQGYITKKDVAKMKDDVWANAYEKQVDKRLHQSDEDPYLYVEKFDFKGGLIESIIFDMDIIKSRQAALEKLAQVTGQQIIR